MWMLIRISRTQTCLELASGFIWVKKANLFVLKKPIPNPQSRPKPLRKKSGIKS